MINFVAKRKLFCSISIALLLVGVVFGLIFGIDLDIQFKGGTILTYSFDGQVDADAFANVVEEQLQSSVSIQESTDVVTGKNSFKVTLTETKSISSDELLALSAKLNETFAGNNIETVSNNTVDPTIGKEFLARSLVAVAVASVLMIIYVGLRFSTIGGWSAGVMAVVALLHDVAFVLATFIIFRMPLNDNFIAIVLTILGYSLNDTIVIYDRIRENKRLYGKKQTIGELVNLSINQSLTRSINTSVMSVLAMIVVLVVALIYNVESIVTFAFPMIIGMIAGVYSSVCIAGPLWVMWQERKAAR